MKTLTEIPGMQEVLEEIRSAYDVAQIIVFGSLARGEDDPQSDIDICIILNSRAERSLLIGREIRLQMFRRLNRAIDILVYDKSEFEQRRDAGASLEQTISREGVAV